MKFALRLSILVTLCLVFNLSSFAQKYTINDFYKVDSIANEAKPKDALALIEQINTQARTEGNSALLIKSTIYRMMFQSYLEENAFDKILSDLRKDISTAKQPEKSILQSLLAESYWNFFQQNLYKKGQRTNVQGNIGDDINIWSTTKLIEEITKTYLASLSETELLQKTNVGLLNDVLAGDKNNRYFRPTLYDLLAHRAIDVFTNAQSALTQAEDENFNFNDPIWFAERNVFLNTLLPTIDSSSISIKALQIFKNLLQFHSNNGNKVALADADFKRLKFISQRNTDKQSYFNALKALANKSEDSEVYADILHEQALLYKNNQISLDDKKLNLVKAVELANEAAIAFPKSIGAKNANNLIAEVKEVELELKTKINILPNQPAQLLLSYKNLDTIYLRIYKRPVEEQTDTKLTNKKKFFSFLEKNQPVRQWYVVVPKSNDYQLHTLVTKIDELPVGSYTLVAQNTKADSVSATFAMNSLTVTNLLVTNRMADNAYREYFVKKSTDGTPLKGVQIALKKYNYSGMPSTGKVITTNENGYAIAGAMENFSLALITLNNDSLLVTLDNYYRRYSSTEDDEKIILFTDRPIYRPGQTIFYKGIFIGKKEGNNVLLTDEKVDITFEDANGKEIEEQSLTTNEFGTFQGSFTIPLGKLNGQMRLYSAYGILNVQVEEYKRPTFEVIFDKLNQRYKLNDSIKVQAKAVAFSGYSVSGAKVSYKIFRRAIYDYRLNYYDYVTLYGNNVFNRQQIDFGKTTSKEGGRFEFNFMAKSANEKINYAFDIEVTVTDNNGETKTKSITINVGKSDLILNVNNGETFFLNAKTDSIVYTTTNLNYVPIKSSATAEWFLLSPPKRLTNKSPFYAENYTLSKEEFIKSFPNDDYDNELDLKKWPVLKTQFKQDVVTDNGSGIFRVSEKELIPGYYKVKFSARNEMNDTISIERFIKIYSQDPSVINSSNEWLTAERNIIEPNESAVFRIAGLSKNSKAYYEVYYRDGISEKIWLNLSTKQTIVKIAPGANYKQSFAVQFTMVHNGTIYNSLQNVYITDPKKQLEIKFLTFRDKLQPGEKESWKLQISNKNGEKEMAEMVATLYDASLDDFKQMNWNTQLTTPFNYYNYEWKFNTNQLSNDQYLWFLKSYQYYGLETRNYENLDLFGYNYYGGYNYGYRNYIERIKNKPKKGISAEAAKELTALAKGKTVHGVVLDNYGYAIPGVSIKSGAINTTTNRFGVYSIDVKSGAELTFAYLGYQTVNLKVGANKRLDTKLFPDGNTLSEVVVVGYGTVKKQNMTASVSSVRAQEIKIRGNSSLNDAVAGLQVDGKIYGSRSSDDIIFEDLKKSDPGMTPNQQKIIPRTNFNETAFFYPQLTTNEKGEININFTIPQSLTRYKMMGFAHTKDLKTATISNEIVTQKQLAISANAPRFFREGDTILFSAKLNNLSGKSLKGDASLQLKDALTGKNIQILAEGEELNKNFELANEGNIVLKWKLIIPAGINAITYKVLAKSGKFSDGEEMTIPVLPNAMLVNESMPINVRANTSKTFNMDKLLKSGSSKTLRHQALTFEFTSNPVWYAIQALPYLMEYPYECAEQTFSRFYANSFATGIINSSPKIAEVFKQWQNTNNGEALLSNLEKNPELKSVLLEETPWVRNADNETERKKRLATLFDLNRMTYELKDNFEKLEKMQYADGSFPWFSGMEGNRYITQHIVLGIGQLKKLKLIDEKAYPKLNVMLNKAIIYLDNQLVKDYKNELNGRYFGYLPLHYIFARSYTNQINNSTDFVKAKAYYINKIATNWKTFDSYQLAQTALVLHRNGNKTEPSKIITLLKQTAQQSDEMGMYWAKNTSGWWWYQNPIETQALLIEAFDEVASDDKAVEEMKIWLLKNKQTNDWKTTKATAAACYALLMKGYDILAENKEPEIKIGDKTFEELGFANTQKEAGTGYQKIAMIGANIKPEMARVDVKNNNQTMAWGALHWQYFEQLDKITPANTGVKIKKQLFIQSTTSKGNLLTPITAENALKIGDLVKVRIEIFSDRDMEYLHLKDMRSSGFEPINVISRYKYQDGLGYYESTKDASTNFFISYLSKGTYVLEYELRVTHNGNFSNGITSLQSMYAPEFNTHSEGIRVLVK